LTRPFLPVLFFAAGLLAGCAPKVPLELAQARGAYQQAASGPAMGLVPAEVHKAEVALDAAEVAFKDDPRGYHTLDLAYVAQRKAELSEALATNAAQARNTATANAEYQAAQDSIMQSTRDELGATRTNLAATQAVAATTSAQLATSELARTEAEARAAAAMAALAKLAAVKEEARGLVITLSGSVLFRSDESALLPAAQTRLAQVADAMLQTKDRDIVVEGHTDSQGSDAYNIDLSQRRAEAVRTFLIGRGYEATRIVAQGIGEARPIADNATAEGRANNRRVEIIVSPSSTAAR